MLEDTFAAAMVRITLEEVSRRTSSGSEVHYDVDVLSDRRDALHLVNALVLGEDTEQWPQLQPPVV